MSLAPQTVAQKATPYPWLSHSKNLTLNDYAKAASASPNGHVILTKRGNNVVLENTGTKKMRAIRWLRSIGEALKIIKPDRTLALRQHMATTVFLKNLQDMHGRPITERLEPLVNPAKPLTSHLIDTTLQKARALRQVNNTINMKMAAAYLPSLASQDRLFDRMSQNMGVPPATIGPKVRSFYKNELSRAIRIASDNGVRALRGTQVDKTARKILKNTLALAHGEDTVQQINKTYERAANHLTDVLLDYSTSGAKNAINMLKDLASVQTEIDLAINTHKNVSGIDDLLPLVSSRVIEPAVRQAISHKSGSSLKNFFNAIAHEHKGSAQLLGIVCDRILNDEGSIDASGTVMEYAHATERLMRNLLLQLNHMAPAFGADPLSMSQLTNSFTDASAFSPKQIAATEKNFSNFVTATRHASVS